MMALPPDKCPACGEDRAFCRASPMSEGSACCPQCRANGYHDDVEPELCYVPIGTTRADEGDGVVDVESRLVAALVTVAGRLGDEEQAVLARAESRNGDPDDDDEATRIVREHGFSPDRLVALRGLARSRDVELEVVLRAALRGSLRDVVKLPPVAPVP